MAARKVSLTTEQIAALIQNVRNCPCLWNPDHEEKVHRGKVANAWADISKQMNLPDDFLRAKWKNLRDLFMKEVKKLNLTSVEDYRGKWKHFKSLWFLYRLYSERMTSEDDVSEITDVFEPNHEPFVKIEAPDTDINQFIFLDTDQEYEASPENGKSIEKNERTRDDLSEVYLEAPKRRRMTQAYTEEDCDMMFLMSLTPFFKLLKPIRKLVLRNKIQETIIREIERSNVGDSNDP